MPDTWMTIVHAATTLQVHPRTIERRIAGGKLEARRTDDGQLQVLINLPDTPDNAPDPAMETVRELAADQVSLARGSASALVRFAQDDAIRAREELAIVRHDAGRARHSALAAWCVVAAMGIGVCVAVGWTAQRIAQANADVRHLNEQAAKVETQAQKLLAERDAAQQEALAARVASAEAAGRLAAYVEQAAQRPATQPTGLLQRVAAVFAAE